MGFLLPDARCDNVANYAARSQTAGKFFSEDGKLLRVLGYGGFIGLKAGYWDLED